MGAAIPRLALLANAGGCRMPDASAEPQTGASSRAARPSDRAPLPLPLGGPSRSSDLGSGRARHTAASARADRHPHRRRPDLRRAGGRAPGPAPPDPRSHGLADRPGPDVRWTEDPPHRFRSPAPLHHPERARVRRPGLGPRRADTAAAPQALRQMAPRLRARPRRLPGGARLATEEAPPALDDPIADDAGWRVDVRRPALSVMTTRSCNARYSATTGREGWPFLLTVLAGEH